MELNGVSSLINDWNRGYILDGLHNEELRPVFRRTSSLQMLEQLQIAFEQALVTFELYTSSVADLLKVGRPRFDSLADISGLGAGH